MSISYNGAEVLRKAGVDNFSKFLRAPGQTEKRKHLEAAIECFERAFKSVPDIVSDRNACHLKARIAKALTNSNFRRAEISDSCEEEIEFFIKAIEHGAIDIAWTSTYASESSRGLIDEKAAKCVEAFERVQTVAIEKIEEAESTRESIKFLSYLEAAIDKISIHLDELKASMYLELCDRLKNLASQERDYFTEKKIPNLADDTDRNYFKIFKGAKEIELLRKCDQILRKMNEEDLKTEHISQHHLLVEEISEMMTRSESAQCLFNARLQMIEALSKKEERFKNAGVEMAIDNLKAAEMAIVGSDPKLRAIILSEIGFYCENFDRRPLAKTKTREYYMKSMALITEFSMPTGFYWAQRARSYITKHQAEINEKYNKQKPRNISEGAKKILVDLAKELEKFKDITAENKYRRTKSFVSYLKKHFPPKRGVLPKFPETKDKEKQSEQVKEGLQKLTRLYHPDINGKHGEDWAAYCEEISKIANNVYGKIVKGMN